MRIMSRMSVLDFKDKRFTTVTIAFCAAIISHKYISNDHSKCLQITFDKFSEVISVKFSAPTVVTAHF